MNSTYRKHAAARANLRQRHYPQPSARLAQPARDRPRVELTPVADSPLARTLLNVAQWCEATADEVDPELCELPDPPRDFGIREGDRVLYHDESGDYQAEVVHVFPARRYVPARYHLRVYSGNGVTPIHCFRERLSILLTKEALEVEAPSA